METLVLTEAFEKEALQLRRYLHQHPELSQKEFQTTELLKRELTSAGIHIVPTNLATGVVASVGQGKTEQVIFLRADIDALPLKEKTGLVFASVNEGASHSCGHDLHTTALLCSAKLLKQYENQIPGRIVFIFQPSEENMSGSAQVLATGIFETYKPQLIVGLHTWPELPAGSIGLKKGAFMAASDVLKITITGRGGHGAHPHKSIDPVCVGAYLITAMQTIISRNVAPIDSGVITIGKVTAGTAANIIPETAVLEGTVRTADPKVRSLIKERLENMLPALAEGFGASCVVEYHKGHPPVVNDAGIIDQLALAAKTAVGEENIIYMDKPSMGSEDFSEYLEKVPGAMFRIGTVNEDARSRRPLHNPEIIFDEEALFAGAKTLVCLGLHYFGIKA